MNRDQLAALARCALTLLAGAALFCAIGRLAGWRVVGAIAITGVADFAWCASRLPARMRPW